LATLNECSPWLHPCIEEMIYGSRV
jgi:hypothetical protein